ncbi:hypothetical protein C8E95_3084 [Pseudonocardia autotrophica]|uniref:Uncharacterized protein n=1 Tax=Pseudonocardia autotrophica TaxID=2074 RepID=A0A1Y2MLK2_PSEAH|nr:hypothetical protein BG845_05759 [Pseudonocardia autotrophica]TDN73971.1 hypothetical protein C8E95_3084 [Pseudonocardia autotrophica]
MSTSAALPIALLITRPITLLITVPTTGEITS